MSIALIAFLDTMTKIEKWFEIFLDKNGPYRKESIKVYSSIWHKFARQLNESQIDLENATPIQGQQFLCDLSENTAKKYQALLSEIYNAAISESLANYNPFGELALAYAHEEKEVPSIALGEKDLNRLLESIKLPKNWKKSRDACMVALMVCSGMKSGEILKCLATDLTLASTDSYIKARAHNRFERIIPLSTVALRFLNNYLAFRKEYCIATRLLFPTNAEGLALNPATLYRTVRRALESAGFSKEQLSHIGPQVLRGTFTYTQNMSEELTNLQQVLGHAQLTSTVELVKKIQLTSAT